jgi:hypothetical protein
MTFGSCSVNQRLSRTSSPPAISSAENAGSRARLGNTCLSRFKSRPSVAAKASVDWSVRAASPPEVRTRAFSRAIPTAFGCASSLPEYVMLQNVWNFRPAVSVEVSMNVIPTQTTILPPARNLRLAGDTTNKGKSSPQRKRTNELAVISDREGWQRDCTKMLDLL